MADRMETAVFVPEGDWPGVFIRGDDALTWAMSLRHMLDQYQPRDMVDEIDVADVRRLRELLESCNTGGDDGRQ